MGIEEFPDIESFQRLPKKLIVKGGDSSTDDAGNTMMKGLVINNLGQRVESISVHLIVFDEKEIPIQNVRVEPQPNSLDQGNMASFKIAIPKFGKPIDNYYLYAQWKYDDASWTI